MLQSQGEEGELVVFGGPRSHQVLVGRNSISSPGSSLFRAPPNRWPIAWAPTAMLPLLSQPPWVLAKGFPTIKVTGWPLSSHTPLSSGPRSPLHLGLTNQLTAPLQGLTPRGSCHSPSSHYYHPKARHRFWEERFCPPGSSNPHPRVSSQTS